MENLYQAIIQHIIMLRKINVPELLFTAMTGVY